MRFKKILALLLAMLTVITPLSALAADEAEEKTFTIASVTPFDGEKEVTPVNLQMDVTFSEPVDASTIKMNNVSVSGSAFAAIIPTGEKTATVYFNRLNIMLGTKYTVTFKSGIKAVSGASLSDSSSTTFASSSARFSLISFASARMSSAFSLTVVTVVITQSFARKAAAVASV